MATVTGNRIELEYYVEHDSLDITPEQWQQICNGCCKELYLVSYSNGQKKAFQVEYVNAQKGILKLFEPKTFEPKVACTARHVMSQ